MKTRSYTLTTTGSFIGIFIQAAMNTLTPVLFVPMMRMYGLTFAQLGALVAINFGAQVLADLIFSGIIDRIGFRRLILPANAIATVGLLLFALTPVLIPQHMFIGLAVMTLIFSSACGLMEVLYSPLINAIPHKNPARAMGLLHSFYAWGQVGGVLITTLLLALFGDRFWPLVVALWALVPLGNTILFCFAPFPATCTAEKSVATKKTIGHPFFIAAMLAIFLGGAAEVNIGQWASSLMEVGFGLPKVTGDLIGMGGYAAMMGLGRVLYGVFASRLNIQRLLAWSALATALLYVATALLPPVPGMITCALCGLSSAMLWPGVLMVASGRFPHAGAWLFAVLAFAGDFGAGLFPWLTGLLIDNSGGTAAVAWLGRLTGSTPAQAVLRFGILCAAVLGIATFATHIYMIRRNKRDATVTSCKQ